jgi:hypothetical protein
MSSWARAITFIIGLPATLTGCVGCAYAADYLYSGEQGAAEAEKEE